MAQVRYDASDFISHMKKLSQDLAEEVGEITSESMDKGKRITQQHISTRATPKVKSLEGRDGRIVTRAMFNAVKGDPAKVSGGKVSGEFGWDSRTSQDYFAHQDQGFTHNFSGEAIPGMNAVFDAFVEVREEWAHKLEKLT